MEKVKKAIVTGASRGVGRGIAFALAEAGYDLVVSYSKKYDFGDKYVMEMAEEMEKRYGRTCHYIDADFYLKDTAEQFIKEAVKKLGGLDLLVNNGMKPVLGGSILDIDGDVLDNMMNSYIRSTFLMMRFACRYMVKNKIAGNVINITSGRADRALPGGGIYGGLKAAIQHASRSFALDVAPYGIRVNCVAPGYIKVRTREEYREEGWTEKAIDDMIRLEGMVPLGRPGKPEEIGNAVAWLASEKAAYITGTVLTVDGALFLPGMPEDTPTDGAEYRGWTYFKPRETDDWNV